MTQRGRGWRVAAVAAAGAVALAMVLSWPVTTRQGVDFQVSTYRLPLYLKAWQFVDRHLQYRWLARQITHGRHADAERVQAVFDWTRAHIRPTPSELPVVDDHPLHIIIRGYGQDDQMADVFTTLTTYAGIPAFWRVVRPAGGARVVLSFAKIEGRWAVFDVARGQVIREHDGCFADVEQLLRRPDAVTQAVGDLAPGGIPYAQYVGQLRPFQVPAILRSEKQMPWPRVVFEMGRWLRVVSDVEPWERPPARLARESFAP